MDISFLAPVLGAAGPLVTVCADVRHDTEKADAGLRLRVRGLTERLEEQGAAHDAVEAVRARLLEGLDDPEAGRLAGRAVIADGDGGVLLDRALDGEPVREVADWSPLPDLLPVLRQLPDQVPHLVVLIDRTGADLWLRGTGGDDVAESVAGRTWQLRKVKAGGWSMLRYHHAAEDVWRRNADQVADVVTRSARGAGARFVLVAGDVRARELLLDRLPEDVASLTVSLDGGGRAPGADEGVVQVAEARLVAEQLARDAAAAAERLQRGLHDGRAVAGLDGVVAALRQGQVAQLLIADTGLDLPVAVGAGPLELGSREELADLGVRQARLVPADRAVLRAAAAQGAEVLVLPRTAIPRDAWVAAVLRFAVTPSADLAATGPTVTGPTATGPTVVGPTATGGTR